ncbi:helix-turn-helix domain-containing protein [Streptomyces sp. NA04227]|uniref:IclR family transcriptional regulator n=1 Tax=Streptomyces sp. NA04227 TaxID=2742136 RepID=UPI001590CCDF|nr:IclR family transcriptional regulator C-terminal domain-containing protein [Streptomyces sp. NA04227]QKW09693.1 helix-turn-helix domain-containing protein [Streptomyces sp. NA04227]
MQMLEYLAEKPMRAKELAERTSTKWATAHRTLAYLREHGFVRRDEATGLHYVGRRLFAIGSSYLSEHPLFHTGEPLMRTASDRVSGFVQLAERDAYASIAIASVEPRTPIPSLSYANTYRPYPLHVGARGLVLLAFAPDDFIDAYLGHFTTVEGESAIEDADALRTVLEQTRSAGLVATEHDLTSPTAAIAAPVRDAEGAVVASASVVVDGREGRHDPAEVREVVLGLARSLSQMLGWRGQIGPR